VHTAQRYVTRVICADVLVITVHCNASSTQPAGTEFVLRACVEIVACQTVGGKLASHAWLARVTGAGICVVTDLRSPRNAETGSTGVRDGADLSVITCLTVGCKNATGLNITGIVGAQVAVVTDKFPAAGAGTKMTLIPSSADAPVVARSLVELVSAALRGAAGIGGAYIVGVAPNQVLSHALATRADIARRTGVSIITVPGYSLVLAEPTRAAGVLRARIQIFAIWSRTGLAFAGLAVVVERAGIPVIARPLGHLVDTPDRYAA